MNRLYGFVLAVIVIWLLPLRALAVEVVETDTEPAIEVVGPPAQANGQIVGLDQGQRAPWTGLLIEQKDLVRWRFEIENLQFRLDRDVRLEKDSCQLRIDAAAIRLDLERERVTLHDKMWKEKAEELANDVVDARKDAVEARKRGFFEQPVFWVVVGAAITGVTFGVGLALAK